MSNLSRMAVEIKRRCAVSTAASWFGLSWQDTIRCECPACGATSTTKKTVSCDDRKGLWHCFSCGESGDVISLVACALDVRPGEAIGVLASRLGITDQPGDLVARLTAIAKRDRAVLTTEADAVRCAKRVRDAYARWVEADFRRSIPSKEEYTAWYLLESAATPEAVAYADRAAKGAAPIKLPQNELLVALQELWESLDRPTGAARDLVTRRQLHNRAGYKPKYLHGAIQRSDLIKVYGSRRVDLFDRAGLLTKRGGMIANNRIVFAIRDAAGRVVSLAGRRVGDEGPKWINGRDTVWYRKRLHHYGLDAAYQSIAEQGTVYVAEGYADVSAMACSGYANTVCSMGTAINPRGLTMLSRIAHRMSLILDGDEAGIRAAEAVHKGWSTPAFRIRVLTLPKHDPDDYYRAGGASVLRRVVGVAESNAGQKYNPYGELRSRLCAI